MTITVCTVKLSDGSDVWDLRLRQGGSEIRLACQDSIVCGETAAAFERAARRTLEDIPALGFKKVEE